MEVILIRHGIAEDRSPHKADDKRALTDKGIEILRGFFPVVKDKLNQHPNPMTRIWSSPLTRAVQTAALLADELGADAFERYDFISSGSYDEFKEAISAQDLRSRIIIVGHEPTLSIWTKQLTGTQLSFRKGGVALITVLDESPRRGILNDYFDPKTLKD